MEKIFNGQKTAKLGTEKNPAVVRVQTQKRLNPPKTIMAEKKVGRNEPCPCGSGKKYKKCCGK
jgi:uncharacterized protein YecA (UPF0149 family)